MSLFIRVEQKDCDARIYKISDLEEEFGYDICEKISNQYINKKQFSILTVNNSYFYKSEKKLFLIQNFSEVRESDYNLKFLVTGNFAENYSRSQFKEVNQNQVLPYRFFLLYKYGSLSKKYYLFPSQELTIGSDKSTDISINLSGIKRKHFSFKVYSKIIKLYPRDGQIEYQGKIVKQVRQIKKTSKIRLLPCGINLELVLLNRDGTSNWT